VLSGPDSHRAQARSLLAVDDVESIDPLSRADRERILGTFSLATLGAAVSGEASALDLLEGIAPPPEDGCARWPANMLLRWQRGSESGYLRGRCKATNLCKYCQRLYVRETVEMLKLDATENAPTIWTVLTAREHLTRAELNEHLRIIRRRLKRSWPDHEWFVQVEFQKRGALHANLLVKGVPEDQSDLWHSDITALWCERVDAEPVGQWTQPVNDGLGALLYISKILAHGLKAEQAPPIGWKGHRTSQTRGYLVRPASVMRLEARASLRIRNTTRRVQADLPDYGAAEVTEIVDSLLAEDAERWWSLLIARDPEHAEQLVDRGVIEHEAAEAALDLHKELSDPPHFPAVSHRPAPNAREGDKPPDTDGRMSAVVRDLAALGHPAPA
jgi:hypothetical protein